MLKLIPLLVLASTTFPAAQAASRPDPTCLDIDWNTAEAMAAQKKPRGLFCFSMFNAIRYANDTLPAADRAPNRKQALRYRKAAEKIGYSFNTYMYYGYTFDWYIQYGDELLAGTAYGSDDGQAGGTTSCPPGYAPSGNMCIQTSQPPIPHGGCNYTGTVQSGQPSPC